MIIKPRPGANEKFANNRGSFHPKVNSSRGTAMFGLATRAGIGRLMRNLQFIMKLSRRSRWSVPPRLPWDPWPSGWMPRTRRPDSGTSTIRSASGATRRCRSRTSPDGAGPRAVLHRAAGGEGDPDRPEVRADLRDGQWDSRRHHQGLNRTENHDAIAQWFEATAPEVSKLGCRNVICFSGNRNGQADEVGIRNCTTGLQRLRPSPRRTISPS